MHIKLDARTKLYMIFVVSIVVMLGASSPLLWGLRLTITIIPIVFLIIEKYYATALRFLILYFLALYLNFTFISAESKGVIMALLVGYCCIIVQFMPAIITAWYVIKTTRIDEFVCVMQKMHIPDGITISIAVVMRFFPTIKEEYKAICDAMKMRGIIFGKGSLVKMIEYRIIPLLFSCVNIGDELSAAAITRGLGGRVKRTSVEKLKMSFVDFLLVFLFSIVVILFLVFKYGK